MLQLDHIMYAVPELESGRRDIARITGVQPVYGGPHPGRGTHNALLSLGHAQYLEIIAPDPAQRDTTSDLNGFDAPRIKTWAVATDDFSDVQRICDRHGLGYNEQVMSRHTPAGPTLNWELLFVTGHGFGELFPFFIDWLESPHPAATSLQGGSLESFSIATHEADRYSELIAAFGIGGIVVTSGPDRLSAKLRGVAGTVSDI